MKPSMLYAPTKRLVDVAVASSVIAVTLPITLPTAIGIRATMGAPVLFRQRRPGLHGRPFEMLKFRSMRDPRPGEDALKSDAARITRLGAFIRKTSIDELPTMLNVLKGDVSLVGPRPLLMRYLDRYTPEQSRRHDVKPGITGWSQVNGRNSISWERKFELDVWYVDHRSTLLDLKILALTAKTVLFRSGISAQGHATMPEFMGAAT